ncbi:MAG TPA: fasciclin domain-containing protein [Anaerolineaceae bacterium]|nr:fasciclin domain-containing protein [Anaerolineaceae bacterium]HOA21302.1 fasciclin domain-containing protein [Anaerolineaceae bacterium]HOG77399.1 fasciclin domain-containing protein [Anaerolineaceae bacterium]
MKKLSVLAVLLALVLVIGACAPLATPAPTAEPTQAPVVEPTPEPQPQTIVDIAVADGRFSTLVTALQAAGLVDTLKGDGPFTVFAPTDEAFAKLPAGTVEALLADIPALTDILLYHVANGKALAADVVGLSTVDTLNGIPVKVTVTDGKVFLNESQVVITDIAADNGVIHVIDSVLLPPKDIVDIAVEDGRFTTLAAALQAAGLVETLKGEGPFTVFAPTDEAFAKLPEGTVEALLADIPALTDILLYHVAEGRQFAADVVKLDKIATAQGKSATISLMDGAAKIDGAQIVLTDILAANGVIHVIDSVILPPKDIVETAVADGRFTTLVAAVQAAGLVDTLKSEGPFTVFAPTDDAFAKLPEGTVAELLKPENLESLQNILLYHVVPGSVKAEQVVTLENAETALGPKVSIKVEEGKVFVNDAEVIITDIQTYNGVIHVIDSVILPPKDIVDIAVADGRFTTLTAALEAAGLVETLKGTGPFTVFAPTDDAFAKLPAGTVEELLKPEKLEALKNILLYHVVEGRVRADAVVSLESAKTVLGQDLVIKIEDGKVYINDAQVIITDIEALNGVIHVIDTVLLPK